MNRVRKTSNGLSSLIINGVLSFDTDNISNSVVDFFSDLFSNRDQGSYDDLVLGDFIQPVVDITDNDTLSCLPSVEEIKRAVFDMELSSAPGPDGFGGTGAPRSGHLAAMADSIIAKFSKWKDHALSMAGRKCMINSIIAASLVHSMMVYFWPRSLLRIIESAMRNFSWSGDILKKNTSCSVSWSRVFSPIEEGGLGIRSLRLANDSFVCKLA
ncbi:hypothetical protein ACS0TY_010907 [Phlomoides rotata]